jgi:2-dehydropantoate 2-reductase
MRVVVVGAGAVGTLVGHALAHAGNDVLLVRRSGPPEPETHGWTRIEPDGSEVLASLRAANVQALGSVPEPDLVLLAVKQYHLRAALASVELWPTAATVTVQNGIGAEEAAAIARPRARIIAASLTASCALPAARRIARLTEGGVGLAMFAVADGEPASGFLRRVADAFSGGGLRAGIHPDARAMKWSKLVGNLVGNALGAISDLEPPAIYADPRLFMLERAQLREALDVMAGLGLRPVALPGAPIPWLARAVGLPSLLGRTLLSRAVASARGSKAPSLLEHARTGAAGPTEVRWLNGAVARAAGAAGVEAPVNAALATLTDEVVADPGLRARLQRRPDVVHAEVLVRLRRRLARQASVDD